MRQGDTLDFVCLTHYNFLESTFQKKILHDEGISYVYVAAVVTGIGTVVAAPVLFKFTSGGIAASSYAASLFQH